MEGIKKDTIARTVALALALVNQILAVTGKELLPFAQDDIYQLISLTCTLIASVVAWWKNNSFTKPAIASDLYLTLFRKLTKQKKEVEKPCESV